MTDDKNLEKMERKRLQIVVSLESLVCILAISNNLKFNAGRKLL